MLLDHWLRDTTINQALERVRQHRERGISLVVMGCGVPPLLFTQVLYGRAFYTSSVLIG